MLLVIGHEDGLGLVDAFGLGLIGITSMRQVQRKIITKRN